MRIVLAMLLLLPLRAWSCGALKISDAWIAEAPPAAEVMAGYAVLTNPDKAAQTLRQAHSADFGAVEFHQMSMSGGMMRMRQLETLEVPAQGVTELSPDGFHLMLLRPVRALKAGDHVRIDFSCGNKEKLSAIFSVKSAP
jgi:copper(I)-binding protein